MTDNANVRVGHCCPDAPNVDIAVDGETAFENVGFKTISEYASLPEGDRQVTVTPHGGGDAVIDQSIPVERETNYSVLATGLLGDDTIEANVFNDDPGSVPSDMTHARLLHTAPDAPAVDVRVKDGGPTIFERVGFRQSSGYKPIDSGTYDLEVVPSGSDDVALELPSTRLEGGAAITAIAMGQLSNDSLSAEVVQDAMPQMEADE